MTWHRDGEFEKFEIHNVSKPGKFSKMYQGNIRGGPAFKKVASPCFPRISQNLWNKHFLKKLWVVDSGRFSVPFEPEAFRNELLINYLISIWKERNDQMALFHYSSFLFSADIKNALVPYQGVLYFYFFWRNFETS